MDHILSMNKDVWFGDELAWSSLVNFIHGPQAKTRFTWRILTRDTEGVRRMIRAGARVEQRCGVYRSSTPLIIACMEGCYDIVRLLLEAGASLTSRAIFFYNVKYDEAVPFLNSFEIEKFRSLTTHTTDYFPFEIQVPHFRPVARRFNDKGLHMKFHGDRSPYSFFQVGLGVTTIPSWITERTVRYGMTPLDALLYGYYYNNMFRPILYSPLLYQYNDSSLFSLHRDAKHLFSSNVSNNTFQSTVPTVGEDLEEETSMDPTTTTTASITTSNISNDAISPSTLIPHHSREFTKIVQYCCQQTKDIVRNNNANELLITAITMRCYEAAKQAITLGGHHAYTVETTDMGMTPSIVLVAAYWAKNDKRNTPSDSRTVDQSSLATSGSDSLSLSSTITAANNSIETNPRYVTDPQMIEIVRLLCMNPHKPRDPTTNQIINHHHCLVAACYLGLVDVIEYLLKEESKCIYTPICGIEIDDKKTAIDRNLLYHNSARQFPYQFMGLFAYIGLTAVHVAVHQNYPAILRLFLDYSPLHPCISCNSRTVKYAVWNNYDEILEILVDQGGMALNMTDEAEDNQQTAVNTITNTSNTTTPSGNDNNSILADTRSIPNEYCPLLFIAALQGNNKMVQYLLGHGANPLGKTPIKNNLTEIFLELKIPRKSTSNTAPTRENDIVFDWGWNTTRNKENILSFFSPLVGAILGRNIDVFRTLAVYSVAQLEFPSESESNPSTAAASTTVASSIVFIDEEQFGAYTPLQLASAVKAFDIAIELIDKYKYPVNEVSCMDFSRKGITWESRRSIFDELVPLSFGKMQLQQLTFESFFDTNTMRINSDCLRQGSPLSLALLSQEIFVKRTTSRSTFYEKGNDPRIMVSDELLVPSTLNFIQQLLQRDANPNIHVGKEQNIPLVFAVEHPRVIQLLLPYQLNIRVQYKGWNLLHYYATKMTVISSRQGFTIATPNFALINLLLDYGMDPYELITEVDNCPFILRLWFWWLQTHAARPENSWKSRVQNFLLQWEGMLKLFHRIQVYKHPDILNQMIDMLFSPYLGRDNGYTRPPLFHYLLCFFFKATNLINSHLEIFWDSPIEDRDHVFYRFHYQTFLNVLEKKHSYLTSLELPIVPDPNYINDMGIPILYSSYRYPGYPATLISLGSNVKIQSTTMTSNPSLLIYAMTVLMRGDEYLMRGNENGFMEVKDCEVLQSRKRLYLENITLLITNGIDINATNSQGFSALHYAAGYENADILQLLIQNGANVHVRSLTDVSVVEALLLPTNLVDTSYVPEGSSLGGPITDSNSNSMDPVTTDTIWKWYRKRFNSKVLGKAINYLFAAGLSFQDKFSNNVPVLHKLTSIASSIVPLSVIQLVIKKGTIALLYDIDSNNGYTVLMQPYPPLDTFQYFVSEIVNDNTASSSTYSSSNTFTSFLNRRDNHGRTALNHWCQRNKLSYIKHLLENGADCNLTDNDNLSPLMVILLRMNNPETTKDNDDYQPGQYFGFHISKERVLNIPDLFSTDTTVVDEYYSLVQLLCRYGANIDHYRTLTDISTITSSSSTNISSSSSSTNTQSIMDIANCLSPNYPFLVELLTKYKETPLVNRKALTVFEPKVPQNNSTVNPNSTWNNGFLGPRAGGRHNLLRVTGSNI